MWAGFFGCGQEWMVYSEIPLHSRKANVCGKPNIMSKWGEVP